MTVAVKICGITDPEALKACAQNGARFVGFVFVPNSKRYVSFDVAWNLVRMVPTGLRTVGLFMDPSDTELHHIVSGIPLDMIQLHGAESPGRVQEIKARYQMPVIKAIPIAQASDLADVGAYEEVVDWLLFDTKLSDQHVQGSNVHGGSGQSFDWRILQGRKFKKPWMLAGGLHADNIADALKIIHPDALDVSSGVESAPGKKSPEKIRTFLQRCKSVG